MTVDDRGEGGVCQSMTVDDRGEGGGQAYLVRPDDVISGQPLMKSHLGRSPVCVSSSGRSFSHTIGTLTASLPCGSPQVVRALAARLALEQLLTRVWVS